MSSGKEALAAPAALIRSSSSRCIRPHSAYPVGLITIEPRAGPFSASSALAITSWYQRGKSTARGVSSALAIRGQGRGAAGGPFPIPLSIRTCGSPSGHTAYPLSCTLIHPVPDPANPTDHAPPPPPPSPPPTPGPAPVRLPQPRALRAVACPVRTRPRFHRSRPTQGPERLRAPLRTEFYTPAAP